MKKYSIVCFAAGLVFALSHLSFAAWELYDNFNSGMIDLQKWRVDDSSAVISIDIDKIKIVHQEGHANDSSWIVINQNPETVFGVKAEITVASCTGDVRARIGGYSGEVGVNQIWSNVQLQANRQRIYSYAGLEEPSPTYAWLYDLFWANFQMPIMVTGNRFIASMLFEKDKIIYEVDGLGKMEYKYPTPVNDPDSDFKGLGTRSSNGDGPCTVYIDNVYVFRP